MALMVQPALDHVLVRGGVHLDVALAEPGEDLLVEDPFLALAGGLVQLSHHTSAPARRVDRVVHFDHAGDLGDGIEVVKASRPGPSP
jgi:hypothetical protein